MPFASARALWGSCRLPLHKRVSQQPGKLASVNYMNYMQERSVRTTADEPMPARRALDELKAGNARYVTGDVQTRRSNAVMRKVLVDFGQSPMAAIVGCADSRCPLEILFDSIPGDLFVLRNAGNTITHAKGSVVGSLEFAVGSLRSRLILVLGHTQCGAIIGATKTHLANKSSSSPPEQPAKKKSSLEGLLESLAVVASEAEQQLPAGTSEKVLVDQAIKVNVFHTMDSVLRWSSLIREKVRSGEVEIHGAVYHLDTGVVEFLGKSPKEAELLNEADAEE